MHYFLFPFYLASNWGGGGGGGKRRLDQFLLRDGSSKTGVARRFFRSSTLTVEVLVTASSSSFSPNVSSGILRPGSTCF